MHCSFYLESNGFFHCRWLGGQDRPWYCSFGKPCGAATQSKRRREYKGTRMTLLGTLDWTGLESSRGLVEPCVPAVNPPVCYTTPVHASALQQLQWTSKECLQQTFCLTHSMNFHVHAHTFRSLPDTQAAEFDSWSWLKGDVTPMNLCLTPLLSLKHPYLFPFCASLFPLICCVSAIDLIWTGDAPLPTTVSKSRSANCFSTGPVTLSSAYTLIKTAVMAKTILLSIHDPTF